VYGYTAAEISQVESVPLGTAKTRVRRGLQKLRASTSVRELGGGAVDLAAAPAGPGPNEAPGAPGGAGPKDVPDANDAPGGGEVA
jgi:hypothetical protein